MLLRKILKPLCWLLLPIAASCVEDTPVPQEFIVVEAWIESGEAPVVILSRSFVPSEEEQSLSDLGQYILKWARVTVSDGEREVVLTGKTSRNHMPPYIYTTGRMFGEVGRTYTLTVDVDENHCVASTVIPPPAELDSAEPVPYGNKEGAWLIKARWHDNPAEKNVYKFFTKIHGVDSLYASARMHFVDDALMAGEEGEVFLTPSLNVYRSGDHWGHFLSGETVYVKFCTMDPACAAIMKSMEDAETETKYPIFVTNRNIPGNVSGALGYFIGYGRTDYVVKIPL